MLFNREKLSKFMKLNGITNSALAKELNVSEGAIRHIVTGIKQPSLAMTCQFAEMMNCTVDELVIKVWAEIQEEIIDTCEKMLWDFFNDYYLKNDAIRFTENRIPYFVENIEAIHIMLKDAKKGES